MKKNKIARSATERGSMKDSGTHMSMKQFAEVSYMILEAGKTAFRKIDAVSGRAVLEYRRGVPVAGGAGGKRQNRD